MICAEKAGEQLAVFLSPLMLRLTQINTEESLHCSKPNAAEVVQAKPLRVFCLVKWQLPLYPVFLDAFVCREFLWLHLRGRMGRVPHGGQER